MGTSLQAAGNYCIKGHNILLSGVHLLVARERNTKSKLPNKVGSTGQGECPQGCESPGEAGARLRQVVQGR